MRFTWVFLASILLACAPVRAAAPGSPAASVPRSLQAPAATPPGSTGTTAVVAPIPPPPDFWVEAPIPGDETPVKAKVPATGAVLQGSTVRLLPPASGALVGARRVGIQIGHLDAASAPDEFPNLRFQLGASVAGIDEVSVNRDVAERVAVLLRTRGVEVDLLPAVIPPGYLADAFVSLHADGEIHEEAGGFKAARGFYRGPHEDALVAALTEAYAAATGLPQNESISPDMTDYYAFAWFRYVHALAPHTPAAVLEMGYLTNSDDRAFLVAHPDRAAAGVAEGMVRFLDAHPRERLFASEITVATVPGP